MLADQGNFWRRTKCESCLLLAIKQDRSTRNPKAVGLAWSIAVSFLCYQRQRMSRLSEMIWAMPLHVVYFAINDHWYDTNSVQAPNLDHPSIFDLNTF